MTAGRRVGWCGLQVVLVALAGVFVLASNAYAGFGFTGLDVSAAEPGGGSVAQAGAHPFEFTTRFVFNRTVNEGGLPVPDGDPKDIVTRLPPGLVGNPTVTPQCDIKQFTTKQDNYVRGASEELSGASCPADSQVGVATVEVSVTRGEEPAVFQFGIYNLVPAPGEPAAFGFSTLGVPVRLTPSLRTGGDYGLTVSSKNTSQLNTIFAVSATFWGVPAAAAHNGERGPCLALEPGVSLGISCPVDSTPRPFLRLPTACSGVPLQTTLLVDSWQSPGQTLASGEPDLAAPGWVSETSGWHDRFGAPLPLVGCNRLTFAPRIKVRPESESAESPTGLDVELGVPQNENPEGLATPDLKDARVTLPEGVAVDPSSANGLAACTAAQIELEGPEPARCPDAAKIGTVEIDTPLLEHPLPGAVYVAKPFENPFHSLLAIYIAVQDPQTGLVVKLAGKVEPDPVTGRLTTTFTETPQLPFEDFKLSFFNGPRAALRTPVSCGTFTTTSDLTPWSSPETPDATPSDSFQITSGAGGGSCATAASQLPFAPSLIAKTTNPTGGAYSPFSFQVSRPEGAQQLTAIDTTLPEGLIGRLTGVAECSDSQIAAAAARANPGEGALERSTPSCPAASQLGSVTVGAGAGPEPFYAPGTVYLAGPYKGAPLSLAIITPAIAGPYDLGTVVVRSALYVDPETARITVKSDPIPTILAGIPLDVRSVRVDIDRPQFTLNPTDCRPMSITTEIFSTGANATPADPFQATGCAGLKFAPKLSASTSAKTSRANGASLRVKLAPPHEGPQAPAQTEEANITRVKVDLPKQLPSRLTTLQKACTSAVFNANPAACPAASIVASAKAITPILPVPLEGPAYFVSHGNEAFPQLILVLKGYGITIHLIGDTLIRKGVTSSTFASVPDVPISSFELTFPQGKYSALGANGNLCTVNGGLKMPTEFQAQNGAIIHNNTKISVTGCPTHLAIKSKRIKGKTTTLTIYAPGAGKLTATGKGLTAQTRSYAGQETRTFKLRQKGAGKLATRIRLTFTPNRANKPTSSLTLELKQ